MGLRRATILGTGHYVPPRVVTNAELESVLDTSDAWIQERTGIKERRWVEPGETGANMSVKAAGQALVNIPGKCIVLTGAMEPAHYKSSDAVFNVGVAVGAVSSLADGVYVAMNGRIFDPFKVRKNRELGVFEEIP